MISRSLVGKLDSAVVRTQSGCAVRHSLIQHLAIFNVSFEAVLVLGNLSEQYGFLALISEVISCLIAVFVWSGYNKVLSLTSFE